MRVITDNIYNLIISIIDVIIVVHFRDFTQVVPLTPLIIVVERPTLSS
jgi:hypothetical protein